MEAIYVDWCNGGSEHWGGKCVPREKRRKGESRVNIDREVGKETKKCCVWLF